MMPAAAREERLRLKGKEPPATSAGVATSKNEYWRTSSPAVVSALGTAAQPAGGVAVALVERRTSVATMTSPTARPAGAAMTNVAAPAPLAPVFVVATPRRVIAACAWAGASATATSAHAQTALTRASTPA